MKKLSLYIFLVLMFCNVGFAECIKGDCTSGKGTYTWADGNKYVGEWKDGKKHGQGTYTSKETSTSRGGKYVGEFSDGLFNGQGTYTWSDGSKYVGEYKNGKQHGQGTITLTGGVKYVGGWSDGLTNGQGTHTWSDGNKYVGEYKDGKKHGQGTITLTDGEKYVGEWKEGKEHGQGTHTWPDGRVEKGIWKDGELAEVVEEAEVVEGLNGKKLYCYKDSGGGMESYAALVFIENKQVKFSYMIAIDSRVHSELSILEQTYIYYEVGETYKGLGGSINFEYSDIETDVPEGEIHIETRSTIRRFMTILDRKTLVLKGMTFLPKCEIVDYDPLEKFEKIYRKAVIKKEKKENKNKI